MNLFTLIMLKLFAEIEPTMVKIFYDPKAKVPLHISWELKGTFLGKKQTFSKRYDSYEPEVILPMRKYQDVDAIGCKADTPKGEIYFGVIPYESLVRVRDVNGLEVDLPYESSSGPFEFTFCEDQLLDLELKTEAA